MDCSYHGEVQGKSAHLLAINHLLPRYCLLIKRVHHPNDRGVSCSGEHADSQAAVTHRVGVIP